MRRPGRSELDLRLCWHTNSGFLGSGWRAGATQELNGSVDYTRYIYQPAPNTFSFAVKGRKLSVSVKTSGAVSVSDAAAPLSASAAKKKKRKPLLKPSTASGGPPTITVPLRLTKAAKSKLKKKGKVKVRARITYTPQGLPGTQTLANTQTAKLKTAGRARRSSRAGRRRFAREARARTALLSMQSGYCSAIT